MDSGGKGNREVELEIFNRFTAIVKQKFTFISDGSSKDEGRAKLDQIEAMYKRPEFGAEKQILNEMNNMGLHKGVLCGLGCFAFLRFSPGAISRMLQRRAGVARTGADAVNPFKQQQSSSSGYKFDAPSTATQPNVERPPGLLFRVVRLSVDTFVSLSVGAYASMYFIPKDKMMKSFSEIPLVEGKHYQTVRIAVANALNESNPRESQGDP